MTAAPTPSGGGSSPPARSSGPCGATRRPGRPVPRFRSASPRGHDHNIDSSLSHCQLSILAHPRRTSRAPLARAREVAPQNRPATSAPPRTRHRRGPRTAPRFAANGRPAASLPTVLLRPPRPASAVVAPCGSRHLAPAPQCVEPHPRRTPRAPLARAREVAPQNRPATSAPPHTRHRRGRQDRATLRREREAGGFAAHGFAPDLPDPLPQSSPRTALALGTRPPMRRAHPRRTSRAPLARARKSLRKSW